MKDAKSAELILTAEASDRVYSSTAIRAARHYCYVRADYRVLETADALQARPDIPVLGVVDAEDKPVGILRRDQLFALVGKPFGREILQRSSVREIAEEARCFDAHADIFSVAQEGIGNGEAAEPRYFPLTDGDGRFRAIVSAQDLANYLSRITQDDIRTAGLLQDRLIAGNELPEGEGWKAAAWTRAAKGVGGDFYFSRKLKNGTYFFALCDVSGKGVAASLIVSMAWGMLRTYDFARGLRELLVGLNRLIVDSFHMEKYLTGFFMVYDPAERRVVAADMGHSHVLLIREGVAHAVRGSRVNIPLGIEMDVDPAVHAYRLREGDGLLVYSDGITEQENADGQEFGEARLVAAAVASLKERVSGPAALGASLPRLIDEYRGRVPQQDDMSFLLLLAR